MGIQFGPTSLAPADRIAFLQNFSNWLQSGGGAISISQAFENTAEAFSFDEYATLKPKMDGMTRAFNRGKTTLAESIRNAGLGFTQQELSILDAAEKTSQLRQAMPSLVDALSIQYNGRKNLVGKLTMPCVIAVVLMIMTYCILTIMMPIVIGPVVDRDASKLEAFPWILKLFWYASVWLTSNRIVTYILVGALVALILLRNTPLLQRRFNLFLLWLTPTRRMIHAFNATLVAYFMPALARSGMPSHQVVKTLAQCVSQMQIRQQLVAAAEEHQNGTPLHIAMARLPFRSSFRNALKMGEATGQLAERIEELKEPYKYDMETRINKLAGTLKGIVMMVMMPMFIIVTYVVLVGPIFALMEY